MLGVNYGWLLEFLLHSRAHRIFIAARHLPPSKSEALGEKDTGVRGAQDKLGTRSLLVKLQQH